MKMSLALGRQTKLHWFYVSILTISVDRGKKVKTRTNIQNQDPELEQFQILMKMSLALGRSTKWHWFHVSILIISVDMEKR